MEPVAQGFDYGQLDGETRFVVEAARDRIKVLQRKTSESIVEIGRCLIQAKNDIPHGQFGSWLEGEFGWTDRTAQRFMAVAEAFQNRQIVGIQPSALYALASGSIPDHVRDEFIARAEQGEVVTHRDVQEAIRETKPKTDVVSTTETSAPVAGMLVASTSQESTTVAAQPPVFSPSSTHQYKEIPVDTNHDRQAVTDPVEADNDELTGEDILNRLPQEDRDAAVAAYKASNTASVVERDLLGIDSRLSSEMGKLTDLTALVSSVKGHDGVKETLDHLVHVGTAIRGWAVHALGHDAGNLRRLG